MEEQLLKVDGTATLEQIKEALGRLSPLARKTLAKSLNSTVTKIRKEISEGTEKAYAITESSLSAAIAPGKIAKKKNATENSLNVTLTSKGSMNPLTAFTVSPTEGKSSSMMAQVRSNGFKMLSGEANKPFYVRFQSGHAALVHRVPGKKYTRGLTARVQKYGFKTDITKIEELYAPAVPHMFGRKEELEMAAEMLQSVIPVQLAKAIDKALKEAAK